MNREKYQNYGQLLFDAIGNSQANLWFVIEMK